MSKKKEWRTRTKGSRKQVGTRFKTGRRNLTRKLKWLAGRREPSLHRTYVILDTKTGREKKVIATNLEDAINQTRRYFGISRFRRKRLRLKTVIGVPFRYSGGCYKNKRDAEIRAELLTEHFRDRKRVYWVTESDDINYPYHVVGDKNH